MVESDKKVDSLFEWAMKHKLTKDPEKISKLYAEARRRWGHLMPRSRIGDIVEETLRKFEES